MRFLSNLFALLLFCACVGFIVVVMMPKVDENMANETNIMTTEPNLDEKKDVPMPSNLHPTVETAKERLIELTKEKGIRIIITDGHRTIEEQDALFKRGRSKEGQVVTHAQGGESYHNYGLAIDFALQRDYGEVIWDMEYDGNGNGKADWMEVVATAKDLGFDWGGDWSSFKDYPHLQMDFGFSIRELKYGDRPVVENFDEDKNSSAS